MVRVYMKKLIYAKFYVKTYLSCNFSISVFRLSETGGPTWADTTTFVVVQTLGYRRDANLADSFLYILVYSSMEFCYSSSPPFSPKILPFEMRIFWSKWLFLLQLFTAFIGSKHRIRDTGCGGFEVTEFDLDNGSAVNSKLGHMGGGGGS